MHVIASDILIEFYHQLIVFLCLFNHQETISAVVSLDTLVLGSKCPDQFGMMPKCLRHWYRNVLGRSFLWPKCLVTILSLESRIRIKWAFALREVSVLLLAELTLGHLCYILTDVPPQSYSLPNTVFSADFAHFKTSPTLSKNLIAWQLTWTITRCR